MKWFLMPGQKSEPSAEIFGGLGDAAGFESLAQALAALYHRRGIGLHVGRLRPENCGQNNVASEIVDGHRGEQAGQVDDRGEK